MSERKELPSPAAKAEIRGPVPVPKPPARPLTATVAPAPSGPVPAAPRLPASSGGYGHVMRPGPAQQPGPAVAPAPQTPQLAPAPQAPQLAKAQQAPQQAPKPVAAVQAAPQAAVAAPAASPPAVTAPAVVSPAPAPKKPAYDAGSGAMPWLKGLNSEPFWSNYRKFAALGTEGMRASMEAGAILVRGVEQLAQEMAALAGEQIVSAAAAAQEIGTCRSFDALVAKQSALAQASYARLSAAADKLSLMSVALVEEVCEPISDEIDAAADRFIKTLAR